LELAIRRRVDFMSAVLLALLVSVPFVVAVLAKRDRTTFDEHDPDDWP